MSGSRHSSAPSSRRAQEPTPPALTSTNVPAAAVQSAGVPSPACPQHSTAPSLRTAQEWPVLLESWTKVPVAAVLSAGAMPSSFFPQHSTAPSLRRAQVNGPPAETWVNHTSGPTMRCCGVGADGDGARVNHFIAPRDG
jgi:hypothetical protein